MNIPTNNNPPPLMAKRLMTDPLQGFKHFSKDPIREQSGTPRTVGWSDRGAIITDPGYLVNYTYHPTSTAIADSNFNYIDHTGGNPRAHTNRMTALLQNPSNRASSCLATGIECLKLWDSQTSPFPYDRPLFDPAWNENACVRVFDGEVRTFNFPENSLFKNRMGDRGCLEFTGSDPGPTYTHLGKSYSMII